MPIDQKIDYLEFPAEDFASIKKFYRSVFDWSFTDYGSEYCAFTDGKINGGFYLSKKHSDTDNGAVLVVLYAIDLEKTRDTIIRYGGEIVKDIFSFPGGRRFQFFDPNGNELAVWSDKAAS